MGARGGAGIQDKEVARCYGGRGQCRISFEGLVVEPRPEDGQRVWVLGASFLLERAVGVAVGVGGHHDRQLQPDLLLQVVWLDDELLEGGDVREEKDEQGFRP